MDLYTKEVEGKKTHDSYYQSKMSRTTRKIWLPGPIIVGAGPSGLAVAACLKEKGISSVILERDNCIASLWQHKTYDRLRLHLPKQFCELPLMSFPSHFPTYPTKEQFLSYLNMYVQHFDLEPVCNSTVVKAEFDDGCGFWRVSVVGMKNEEFEYVSKWLIVASGENAEEVFPHFDGIDGFLGRVIHSSSYTSGECFRDKNVLVVGCGNSGMEVCLDLCNHNARTSLVVRDTVHVLPQEMLGRSTFGVSMELLKWFPVRFVDAFLLVISRFMLGNTARFGLHRPKIGPLQFKSSTGKTPVLDIGTIPMIRNGTIKVVSGIRRLLGSSVEFVDGIVENFDAVILATGYRSNVPTWLKENKFFSQKDGLPNAYESLSNNTWKGDNGLYAIGFSKRGLLGTSTEAKDIAIDIYNKLKVKTEMVTVSGNNSSTQSRDT